MAIRGEEKKPGKQTGLNKYFDIHKPVFWPSVLLITAMIVATLSLGSSAEDIFSNIQAFISNNGGWFFVIAVNVFILFSLFIAFSRFGDIKLGGDEAEPDFSTLAWFAMLFSAGMGIGIMFWSVAEPIFHYLSPPTVEGGTTEAAQQAMNITYLHWGFHAWGIYAVVGLSLAFFAFNRNLPLSFRSVFYPLIGDRIKGWMGDVIDVLAVLATLFGLATSLGLGVLQVSAGLEHVFGLPDNIYIQVGIIIAITGVATLSVVLGIDKGVRVLSEFNVRIAALFLVFVIFVGPTIFIMDSFVQNFGGYLNSVATFSFWTESYAGSDWQNSWTIFYWAWWISWSPYVGMFIARISKGRTVKQFVLGVLIVPSIITFLWMSAFGGSAISLEMQGIGNIGDAVNENVATALFVFLEQFPLEMITSVIAIVLILSFFVTSSDSGSLVIDGLTSGGKLDAPVGQRIFWAQTEGLVAAILLVGGGLSALQTASISTGLPFALILLVMCYSLQQGLRREYQEKHNKIKQEERDTYRELVKDTIEKQKDEV
ncbi:BCCT family transporter [Gracilimonas mengyeensis]|uniref:Choline/glycine/proline betaine transport protein n=1 Tax=Gracilimonas mengyeensis TaxID=1302730 RepID=A0A521BRQ8_9BACT|nr:BCCT family transporter [Gracilimonas mengyeensis]SMO49862.1 choline/glycine/proline betaine transport protein [Gracilimonas mengyeensis]